MVMMAVSGLATLVHAGHSIYRDMTANRRRDHSRDDGPGERAARPAREEPPQHTEIDRRTSWVHKARVAGRTDGPTKAWTEHAAQRGHARQH